MVATKTADYDAIVVGTGFSGVRSLWEITQLGLTVKCFEAGSDVGGAWYWNRYPGARTDSEAWAYTLNFAPGLKEEWKYSERYPSQQEVQEYIGRLADRFDFRKHIQFNTRVVAAHYSESNNLWTITTAEGLSATCRFFLPATGPLSIAKTPPFEGLGSFTGEWYQASNWPKHKVDFHGKRIAVIGTGATGVQIIPKLASVAKELTVFQRTPNYVLPGRNYFIDENEASSIKKSYESTLDYASKHPFGLAMKPSGKTIKDMADASQIRQILDSGWETGGFHFQFETFDDLFTNQDTNDITSEYLRQKIRAIVKDEKTAEILTPKYPFLSKRPPCGHFYYETFNRPNVNVVDLSHDEIIIYENGIRTRSGTEHELDMIIFALGYDAATGALSEMDVRGVRNVSLADNWAKQVSTFAGILAPEFPNMFMICGPHIPFGNMPVVLDIQVDWIGRTLRHMNEKKLDKIEVSQQAADAWSSQMDESFRATLFADSAKAAGSWFVGANIPGKAANILFYFGGVPAWNAWLDSESRASWASMKFSANTAYTASKAVPQPDIQAGRNVALAA